MKRSVDCPKCLGTGEEVFVGKKKSFAQKKCNLCDGMGLTDDDLAEDFIESNIIDNEWI